MLLERDFLSAKLYARLSAMSKTQVSVSLSRELSAFARWPPRVLDISDQKANNFDPWIENFDGASNARFPLTSGLDHRTRFWSSDGQPGSYALEQTFTTLSRSRLLGSLTGSVTINALAVTECIPSRLLECEIGKIVF